MCATCVCVCLGVCLTARAGEMKRAQMAAGWIVLPSLFYFLSQNTLQRRLPPDRLSSHPA